MNVGKCVITPDYGISYDKPLHSSLAQQEHLGVFNYETDCLDVMKI